jgi:hypothetical protein
MLSSESYNKRIVVKFKEGLNIDLQDKREFIFSQPSLETYQFNNLIEDFRKDSLFRSKTRDEYRLAREELAKKGKTFPDFSLFYEVLIEDVDRAWEVAEEINEFDFVEYVYLSPKLVMFATPDYSGFQSYLGFNLLAPDNVCGNHGINVCLAWEREGGKGENVDIALIEEGWFLRRKNDGNYYADLSLF